MTARIEYKYNGKACLSGVIKMHQAEKQLKIYKATYGENCKVIHTSEQY